MRSSSPLVRLLASPALSLRARLGLLLARGRRSVRPAHAYAARYGRETIFLSQADFDIDLRSLAFVVVDAAYDTDYRDSVVLDLGAHKGYYGAYAAARGARAVIAYEPEDANVALLERTASADRGGTDWRVRTAAVDDAAGEAELHVMNARGDTRSHLRTASPNTKSA